MRSLRRIGYLVAATILGISQAGMAQAKEEDSAYQWGRWAVLSPAAGGAEPYVAPDTPGAEFNARPGDASQFQPEILSVGTPSGPPGVVPNPPGNPPPSGDPRGTPPPIIPPGVVSNPPGSVPPTGDPRGSPPPIVGSN
jgi:hypothetical protein